MTAAVNAGSNPFSKPIELDTLSNMSPNITPAAPETAEPTKNANAITRSVSMPIIVAASRSTAVARIALPICVRATRSVSRMQEDDRQADGRTSGRIEMFSGPHWMPSWGNA